MHEKGRKNTEDYSPAGRFWCRFPFGRCRWLPLRQGGREGDEIGLQHANAEGTDGVIGFDAGAVFVEDGDARRAPRDVFDDGVQKQSFVIWFEVRGSFSFNKYTIASLVIDEIVYFGETIVCLIIVGYGEFFRANVLSAYVSFPLELPTPL